MFIQRLITSLILVPLVLITLFFGNPWILATVLLLVTFLAGIECWRLIPIVSNLLKMVFTVALVLSIAACFWVFPYWQVVGLTLWIFAYLAILGFPSSGQYWGFPIVIAGAMLVFWPFFMVSLGHLYELPQGKGLVLYLLFIVWAADVGGYLAGKRWGTHALIPKVSPGKTWEGVTGGLILALIIAFIGYCYYKPQSGFIWFALVFITVIVSIFGDLFISVLKRRCHLKDTGAIIPGHGGILDRLDSLMAATPVFYFGLTYFSLGI